MEKAYDRLEWNFIYAMLQHLGFSMVWINWIRACLSSVSFSVLANGIPGDRFFPSRGIRQGDPLSPYLFILCAELLARQFHHNSMTNDKLVGVSIGKSGVKVHFLTFADDTMIFAKANKDSCVLIKSILDKYCSMSGQLVNFNKSAFQCTANVSDSEIEVFQEILNMDYSSSLDSYLGCPIIDRRVTKETFMPIVNKVQAQLPKWKANSLSQAGRAVLIQANLATKANYQMQSFLLPKTILNKLDSSYRNFFWNKENQSKSPNLIGWDRICTPKPFGGLGFRKADVNNIAHQMKLLWRLLKNDNNLWVILAKRKYCKNRDFLNYKVSPNSSWQWKKLMSLRPLFRSGLRWQVGICILISQIFIPTNDVDDEVFWGPAGDGIYSVKSGARHLIDNKIGSQDQCRFVVDLFLQLEEDCDWPQIPVAMSFVLFRQNLQVCIDKLGMDKTCQLAMGWWFVWFARNKIIFSEEAFSVRQLSCLIVKFANEWNLCKISQDNMVPSKINLSNQVLISGSRSKSWVPPPQGFFKINFDGSKYQDGRAAFGFVIRNYLGDAILAGCNSVPADYSIVQAEAAGLREAITAARFLNLENILIEGDNLSVINSLLKIWKPPWSINAILSDAGLELSKFRGFSIAHCFPEANRAADFMAHEGHRATNLIYKFPPYSLDFSLVIRKDVLGWPPD
ncbi:uncharacterized protein LOC104900847 [Beta vulgaris subsp. vulgaris]|uniref:uncharacterized protein LOC104900847 n=1 Tax=Beta vulgaris subsp. vulgaris TaxID=3555 RepID=UPI0020370FA9|nr:uncharacterized protein LOC104900847 [Beta vulgaris subsp. vulgaris]